MIYLCKYLTWCWPPVLKKIDKDLAYTPGSDLIYGCVCVGWREVANSLQGVYKEDERIGWSLKDHAA